MGLQNPSPELPKIVLVRRLNGEVRAERSGHRGQGTEVKVQRTGLRDLFKRHTRVETHLVGNMS